MLKRLIMDMGSTTAYLWHVYDFSLAQVGLFIVELDLFVWFAIFILESNNNYLSNYFVS